jgi:CRP-like cAMP-binding protein
MESTSIFRRFINKFVQITDEEYRQYLLPIVRVRKFDKKESLLRVGDIEDSFNFILRGLIRKYYLKGTEEINTQISYEGHIIHSQESFHSRTPSEYAIETIEPSTVVSISYNDMEALFSRSQQMERLGRLVITYTMVLKDRWQMQLVKLNPRDRFLQFVTRHGELLQRVPQKFLASYLNIKPETFSRFKHLIKGYAAKSTA